MQRRRLASIIALHLLALSLIVPRARGLLSKAVAPRIVRSFSMSSSEKTPQTFRPVGGYTPGVYVKADSPLATRVLPGIEGIVLSPGIVCLQISVLLPVSPQNPASPRLMLLRAVPWERRPANVGRVVQMPVDARHEQWPCSHDPCESAAQDIKCVLCSHASAHGACVPHCVRKKERRVFVFMCTRAHNTCVSSECMHTRTCQHARLQTCTHPYMYTIWHTNSLTSRKIRMCICKYIYINMYIYISIYVNIHHMQPDGGTVALDMLKSVLPEVKILSKQNHSFSLTLPPPRMFSKNQCSVTSKTFPKPAPFSCKQSHSSSGLFLRV